MILGFVGRNGAGKDIAADYLVEHKGFVKLSFSDELRAEATKRGLTHTRTDLVHVASILRKQHHKGYLSEVLLQRARNLQKQGKENIAVVSIRNPAEVEELRKVSDFVLIAICADIEIRFSRLSARGRIDMPKDLAGFKEQEEYEENNTDPTKSQIAKCMDLADIYLDNNASKEELAKSLEKLVAAIDAKEIRTSPLS